MRSENFGGHDTREGDIRKVGRAPARCGRSTFLKKSRIET